MATMLPGRAAEHVLGVLADRLDPAVDLVDGHDRRLVDDDALAARVDAGIGRAQVDGQVTREQRKHRTKTQRKLLVVSGRGSRDSGAQLVTLGTTNDVGR